MPPKRNSGDARYVAARSGIWFEDKELIDLQRCGKLLGEVDAPYLPFCRDVDDNMLVVDCDSEAVYEWDLNDGKGSSVDASISHFLEDYRDKLLAGRFEYMDGDGCMEVMASSPVKSKGK